MWRQLYHCNVLPFLGICSDEFAPFIALVSPWAAYGDLRSFLREHASTDRLDMVCLKVKIMYTGAEIASNQCEVFSDLEWTEILTHSVDAYSTR